MNEDQNKVLGMLYVLENAILNRDFSLDDEDARSALRYQIDSIRELFVAVVRKDTLPASESIM